MYWYTQYTGSSQYHPRVYSNTHTYPTLGEPQISFAIPVLSRSLAQ